MIYEVIGIAAFAVFWIYDVNSVIWKNKIAEKSFFAGSVMILAAGIGTVYNALSSDGYLIVFPAGIRITACFAGIIFTALLVYTLFFAIPFKDTYVYGGNEERRTVCRSGVYAMCRHPGILWFAGVFICLCIVFTEKNMVIFSITVCLLNMLYAAFQDKWTFIHTFSDYESYKTETPFLVPRISDIAEGLKTMKG